MFLLRDVKLVASRRGRCDCNAGGEGWDCNALPAAGGWERYALTATGRDGIVTPYRRRGGMGLQRPTGGGGMGVLHPTGDGEGWNCNALPAAGRDGIATPYRRRGDGIATPYRLRGDGSATPYRRRGGMGWDGRDGCFKTSHTKRVEKEVEITIRIL